jgi:hypothetical protein
MRLRKARDRGMGAPHYNGRRVTDRRHSPRRLRAVVLATVAVWVAALCTVRAADATREYQVKAAYIYNFSNFVVWPATAFAGPAAPFDVCTVGEPTWGTALDDTLRNEQVAGHPMRVVVDPQPAQLRTCHILAVVGDPPDEVDLLRAVQGAPVLTIGESARFLARGGVIRFALDQGRVRFDINPRTAAAAGLTLNARLLQVAREVQQ